MAAPTNVSFATAIDIGGLPAAYVQNVHDAGTTYTVFVKLTAPANAKEIGAFGFGGTAGAGYRPTVTVYDASQVAVLSITAQNKPIQFPATGGALYYLKFTKNADVSPSVLTLAVEAHAPQDVPEGSILITDDTAGFPAAILSATEDYTVLEFNREIPDAEHADILADGRFMVADQQTDTLKIFSPDRTLYETIPSFNGPYCIRTCRGAQRWYVSNDIGATTDTVKAFYSNGGEYASHAVSVTTIIGLAVSNDESILYYVNNSTTSAVHRWDLVNGIALSDFMAAEATYNTHDLLVLADDTILVQYKKAGAFHVKRFTAAGDLLNTYTFDAYVAPALSNPRMGYDLDDGHFWVFLQSSDIGTAVTKFIKVRVSDGVHVTTRPGAVYNAGHYSAAETATPLARFGHSSSCPVMILGTTVAVPLPSNESVPCCPCDCPEPTGPSGSPSTAPLPTHTGPTLPPANTLPESGPITPLDDSYWERLCAGAGTVPEDADEVDYESWVRV